MKNLMTYINPTRKFQEGLETNVRIQIDNSLDLGWKKQDLILVTNFPYQYKGVKAITIDDTNYRRRGRGTDSKIASIVSLFKLGLITDDVYWYHDLDAFQNVKNINPRLGAKELGMAVDKTFTPPADRFVDQRRWIGGSIFFKQSAQDIFAAVYENMLAHRVNEETSLMWSELNSKNSPHPIGNRLKALDQSFNFAVFPQRDMNHRIKYYRLQNRYESCKKPLKIVHFRVDVGYYYRPGDTTDNIKVILHGQNSIGKPLLSPRLIKIFNHYGVG